MYKFIEQYYQELYKILMLLSENNMSLIPGINFVYISD